MKLEDIEVGGRFFITAIPEWKGEVLHQGSAGTRVKREGTDQTREIRDRIDGTLLAEFTAPGKPTLISSHTEVTRL
jgi:hypothetical protein